MDNVAHKLSEYFEYKGITQSEIASTLGVTKAYVNALFKGRSSFGKKQAEKFGNHFGISPSWLLTGEGDMLLDDTPAAPTQDTKPHLPIAVIAGRMGGISEAVRLHECEQLPVVYAFPRYDYTMMVQGDSMEPKYEGGDRIAIRKVCDYVEWGKTYVVDTADGALLKRIYDEGDTIRCVSFNKDYPDFHVNKQNIYGLYKVVGLLRVNQ